MDASLPKPDPVARPTNVLVVGVGVAGIGAAVRAAREGAHTILIETRLDVA